MKYSGPGDTPLNYLEPTELYEQITNYWHALDKGDEQIFYFYDIYLLATDISANNVTLGEAHKVIFGENGKHRSIMSLKQIKDVILSVGFNIKNIDINKHKVTILAEKP